jgi:hypothetical protein
MLSYRKKINSMASIAPILLPININLNAYRSMHPREKLTFASHRRIITEKNINSMNKRIQTILINLKNNKDVSLKMNSSRNDNGNVILPIIFGCIVLTIKILRNT